MEGELASLWGNLGRDLREGKRRTRRGEKGKEGKGREGEEKSIETYRAQSSHARVPAPAANGRDTDQKPSVVAYCAEGLVEEEFDGGVFDVERLFGWRGLGGKCQRD